MASTMLLLLLLHLPLWLKLLQLSRLLLLLKLPQLSTTQPLFSTMLLLLCIMQLPLSITPPLLLRLYPSQLLTPTLEPILSSQPQSSRLSQSWLEDKQARCHSVLLLLLKTELLYNIINKKDTKKISKFIIPP